MIFKHFFVSILTLFFILSCSEEEEESKKPEAKPIKEEKLGNAYIKKLDNGDYLIGNELNEFVI